MTRLLLVLPVLAACSSSQSPKLDAGTVDDARVGDGAVPDAPPDAMGTRGDAMGDAMEQAYRHTITIDGTDDFVTAERFPTTTAGFGARITWDDDHVFVAYQGPDLDPSAEDAGTKWLFVYLDLDPGAATGATQSQTYNTQHAVLPTGFGAELYARWKCDGTYSSIEQHDAGTWSSVVTGLTAARTGDFLEIAIPRSLLGTSSTLGVVTWMINERGFAESSWAGLYDGNFADGYATSLAITKYLRVDFTSPNAPNDPGNEAP